MNRQEYIRQLAIYDKIQQESMDRERKKWAEILGPVTDPPPYRFKDCNIEKIQREEQKERWALHEESAKINQRYYTGG